MVDFTATRLEQLAASAYDLAFNGFGSVPSGGARWRVCDEPYCGGLYWDSTQDWQPEAPPKIDKNKLLGLEAAEKGAAPGGLDNMEKERKAKDKLGPHVHQRTMEEVLEDFAKRGTTKLEYVGAQVYPPLDKPIAKDVKLQRAGRDEWPSWLGSRYAEVPFGHTDFKDVRFLQEHLTPFLRVDTDIKINGTLIRKGSTLLSVKPKKHPLRVYPWIGSKDDLSEDKRPMMLTFGEAPDPFGKYEEPADVNVGLAGQSEKMKPQKDKETINEARTDYALLENTPEGKAMVHDFNNLGTIYGGSHPAEAGAWTSPTTQGPSSTAAGGTAKPQAPSNDIVGAPAPLRPIGQPRVVPVKRLDIVMRKAHDQQQADYEPPLQQSQDKFWSGLKTMHEFFDVDPPELLDKSATRMTGESVFQAPDLPLNFGEGSAEYES